MNRIYQRFAVAVASTTILAIIGSISKAEAFQFFSDRTQWQAALNAPTKTLDFGERRLLSESTVFPNGVSASVNVINGQGFAEGTTVGATFTNSGIAVAGTIDVRLPSGVNALGLDASAGPFAAFNSLAFITETGSFSRFQVPSPTNFYGVISEQNDSLLTGFRITSMRTQVGFFNARNISYPSISVPEGSSTLSILVSFGTFGLGTAFLRRQKQQKSGVKV
ncbi:MAG: hypothetical protein ACR2LR_14580 [Hassallia sp.]